MVLNSQHSLTASTTVASIVSAAVLTAVGLCIPYTERAAKNRSVPPAQFTQGQPLKAAQSPRRGGESGVRGPSSPSSAENAAQH